MDRVFQVRGRFPAFPAVSGKRLPSRPTLENIEPGRFPVFPAFPAGLDRTVAAAAWDPINDA
jgi:hypothetical protein